MYTNQSFYPVDSLVEPLESGQAILTPNHRLARRIKLAWGLHQQAQGRNAWPTPRVMSLEHWWQHCYRQRLLAGDVLPGLVTATQSQSLWLACVNASDAAAALLRPSAAAELAREAYNNLTLWNVDLKQAAIAQQFGFGEDSRLFLEWAKAYERRVEQLGLSSLAALVPGLAESCPVEALWLAEFGDIPPLYRAALEQQAGELQDSRAGRESAQCSLQPCDSHAAELVAAVRWVRERHQADPAARLGIVVPGLQQERSDVERLLQREFGSDPRRPETLPVNFSAGQPLANCGPVRAALGLLALSAEEMSLSALGQVLHSRYRAESDTDIVMEAWQRLLLNAREPVSPQELRRQLGRGSEDRPQPELLTTLLKTGDQRALRKRRLPSEWVGQFEQQLTELGWPGPGPLDSLEYQQAEHFYQALDGLPELDAVEGDVDYRGALGLLTRIANNAVFQAQTPDAPVQVLGLLEAAGLQFDALWLCNMGDREWPQPARPSPFIPAVLQRELGMPHADAGRELAYARQLIEHLRQSCGEIIASYARMEDEVAVAPSPLLADFELRMNITEQPHPVQWDSTGSRMEELEDLPPPPVSAEEGARIRGGSAIIGNQAQCPFRAFAMHRLGARPFDDPQVALTPRDRGAILHDAMNHLWGELEDSAALASMSAADRQSLCAESANVALEAFRAHGGRVVGEALLALEQRRLEQLLVEWLDIEGERNAFTVVAREQRHELTLGHLNITLRIDRVDQLENGRKLVIDYKTGDSKVRLWLGERPEDPQLPLYTQLLGPDEVEGISFAVLRPRSLEYRGLATSEQGPGISPDIAAAHKNSEVKLDDWTALQSHWQQVLMGLAQEFLDGHAPVEPIDRNRSCAYCGLEALCRVR